MDGLTDGQADGRTIHRGREHCRRKTQNTEGDLLVDKKCPKDAKSYSGVFGSWEPICNVQGSLVCGPAASLVDRRRPYWTSGILLTGPAAPLVDRRHPSGSAASNWISGALNAGPAVSLVNRWRPSLAGGILSELAAWAGGVLTGPAASFRMDRRHSSWTGGVSRGPAGYLVDRRVLNAGPAASLMVDRGNP